MPAPRPYPIAAAIVDPDALLRAQRDWALGMCVEAMNIIDNGWKWPAKTLVEMTDTMRFYTQEALDEIEKEKSRPA